MRQVPTYGLIGDGRMARHFGHYLKLLTIPYYQWSRANDPDKDNLTSFIQQCNPILILINDDAIEPFLLANPICQSKNVVHFSGQLATPYAHSAHPLMTFGQHFYTKELYQKIPFILDNPDINFMHILPGLNNPHFTIAPELKNYYHCLCTMSSNFTVLLWQNIFNEFEKTLHIPHETAHLFLEQTCQNLLLDANSALTGPLVRNDKKTIAAHLNVLEDDSFLQIYRAFLAVFQSQQKNI